MQVKKGEQIGILTVRTLSQDQLEVCMKDWAELADEYRDLELRHKEYREVGYFTKLRIKSSYYSPKYNVTHYQTLEKCMALQKKCTSGVTHQVC